MTWTSAFSKLQRILPAVHWRNSLHSVVAVVLRSAGSRPSPAVLIAPASSLPTEYILKQVLDEKSHHFYYPFHQARIVAGLFQNKCWRPCVENETHAYALARVILLYARYYAKRKDSMLDDPTVADALALTNEWLKPKVLWVEFPSEMVVCAHLFGLAWASLIAENIDSEIGSPFLESGTIAYARRPPFLPGLYPGQQEAVGVPLPELGVAP